MLAKQQTELYLVATTQIVFSVILADLEHYPSWPAQRRRRFGRPAAGTGTWPQPLYTPHARP